MTFNHLEETLSRLPDKNIKRYFKVFEDLQEPTKTVLGYTLDIASYLNSINLGDDYTLFGGYSVLSHLMDQFGEEIALFWRGSKDIDMVATPKAYNAILAGYQISCNNISPNLKDKRTIKLIENQEKECKIDLYVGDNIRRFYNPEVHNHFGVSLRTCDPLTLIEGKLFAPYEEEVHSIDIVRMLGVLEKRKDKNITEISRFFTADQKVDLIKRIRLGERLIRRGRFDFVASFNFTKDLRKTLHRGRPVMQY